MICMYTIIIHLVLVSNRLVDVDGILLVAIVSPTVLPVTLLSSPVGEPEELGVGGIATEGDHFLESRLLSENLEILTKV